MITGRHRGRAKSTRRLCQSQRLTASVVAVDPDHRTGKSRYARNCRIRSSAARFSTAGGIRHDRHGDGTLVAMDEQTLDELWSVNVGTGSTPRR